MFKEYWRFFKKYWKLAEPSKWLFVGNLLTMLLYRGFAVARPFVASLIIAALVEQNVEKTYLCILIYFLLSLGYRMMQFLNRRFYSFEVNRDYLRMQDKIFNKLIKIDGNFTHEVKKGQFMNTVNGDLFNVSEVSFYALEYVTMLLQIVVILVIVGTYNVEFSVLIMISLGIYVAICNRADRKFNMLWNKKRGEDDNYSSLVGQVADGLQEVKAFNMLPRLYKKMEIIQHRHDKYYKEERRQATIWGNDVNYIYYGFQALLYVVLVVAFMNGGLELNVLILIVTYHELIVRKYAGELIGYADNMRLADVSAKRIESILNYRLKEEFKFGRTSVENLRGKVEFKNVSLNIGGKKIVSNLSLKVKPREVVAIVGLPGAGKTMILDMLLRLQQPTKGKILLDDININDFSREIYTSSVAVANQAPFIFNISIRDNLGFANTDIRAQIKACKTVGIHDFIETLPRGYNTILRENASNVSGGQKQLISIARTVLTDAEVLLLDDITTSLDPDTATFVPKLIRKLKKDHTILMVTKKPELMEAADKIVVMNEGKVEAIGTHKSLIRESETYRALQFASSVRKEGNV